MPEGTVLAEHWARLERPAGRVSYEWLEDLDDLEADERDEAEENAAGAAGRAERSEPLALSDLVTAALLQHPPDERLRSALLATSRDMALGRARHIVSHQFRGAYGRAAAVAAAAAEAYVLAGAEDEGHALVEGLRREFPRHSAFKRALAAHEDRSAVLAPRSG